MTREEAIKILKSIRVYECYPKSASEETKEAIDMAIEVLSAEAEEYEDYEHATLVDIKEPLRASSEAVQGEWIDTGNWMGIECSRCKCHSRYVTPFCPQCGARMYKGGDTE